MAQSKIEWTEMTWNPVTGCTKISAGCKHCYAEIMSARLKAMGSAKYANGFKLTLHPEELETPLKWSKPRIVFVNSMSDLFHKDVPDKFIQQVFETMERCPQHRFQVLTKRSDRLRKLSPRLTWPENVWMGVSVESRNQFQRIRDLQQAGARVKFLSLEPLLEALPRLPLKGIDWVIAGGESGPGARPMEEAWVLGIRNQCREAGVAFFFKQWGGINKKKAGRLLGGKTYDEMPVPAVAA